MTSMTAKEVSQSTKLTTTKDTVLQLLQVAEEKLQKKEFDKALDVLDKAVEIDEDDSFEVWKLQAQTHYSRWVYFSRNQDKLDILVKLDKLATQETTGLEICLKDTYNMFIVAMAYPENKRDPDLLLELARLYIEFGSFTGSLSMCSLLVESFAHYKHLNKVIFLSAVGAKCLERHQESAQYFDYLKDNPPYNLHPYIMHFFAAHELEFCQNYRDQARETITESYRLMVSKPPSSISELKANEISRKRRKKESERVNQWYGDPQTWEDIASQMATLDYIPLILDCYEQAISRGGGNNTALLIDLANCYLRLKHLKQALKALELANRLSCYHLVIRFLLAKLDTRWKKHFDYEEACCLFIQRVYRGYRGRLLTLKLCHELTEKNIRIYAFAGKSTIRLHQSRARILESKRKEKLRESKERVEMGQHDHLALFMLYIHSAKILQGFYKIIYAKNIKQERRNIIQRSHKLMEMAYLHSNQRLMQDIFELFVRFLLIVRQEKLEASLILQRNIRRFLAKQQLKRLKSRHKRNQLIVHTALGKRGYEMKKQLFIQWKRITRIQVRQNEKSAIRIQTFFRGYYARQKYRKAYEKHHHMQKLMNQMIFTRNQHAVYLCLKAWRKYQWDMQVLRCNKCIIIQAQIRGYLARIYVKKKRSRMLKCEKFVQISLKKIKMAMKKGIYEAWVGYNELCWIQKENSCIKIQCKIRCYLAKKRFQLTKDLAYVYYFHIGCIKMKKCNVKDVTRWIFIAVKYYKQKKLEEQEKSAAIIQALFRGRRRRKEFQKYKQQMIVKKRCVDRMNLMYIRTAKALFSELKKLHRETVEKKNQASRRIQLFFKRILQRKKQEELLSFNHRASRFIQVFRDRNKYQHLRTIFNSFRINIQTNNDEKDQAAQIIQNQARIYLSLRRGKKLMAQRAWQKSYLSSAHAQPIQYYFKKWEQICIEKCCFAVFMAVKSSFSSRMILSMAPKNCAPGSPLNDLNIERTIIQTKTIETQESDTLPPMAYYSALNQVLNTGICHLMPNNGLEKKQIVELFKEATTLIMENKSKEKTEKHHMVIEMIGDSMDFKIEKVVFYNTIIDIKYWTILSECLLRSSHHITSLVLGNCPIGNTGAMTIATSICQKNCQLQQLILDKCSIGNPGGCALAYALSSNHLIQRFDISGNHISDQTIKYLSETLISNTSLRVIGLNRNFITDSGILNYLSIAILSIPRASALEVIQIQDNHYTFADHTISTLTQNWNLYHKSLRVQRSLVLRIDFGTYEIGTPKALHSWGKRSQRESSEQIIG